MTTWATGPWLGFDTETTGVSTGSDRIVTAALVTRIPGVSSQVDSWLINPGVDIPPEATAVHGISTEFAAQHGQQPADALEQIAAAMSHALASGAVLVAFNAGFDIAILEAELARYQLPTLAGRLGHPVSPVIDPLVLDRWKNRWRKGQRKLSNLVEVYGVETGPDGLHNAEVDVLATLDVLHAQVRAFPELAAMSLDQLHQAQAQAHRQWAVSFNSWLSRQGRVADVDEQWL